MPGAPCCCNCCLLDEIKNTRFDSWQLLEIFWKAENVYFGRHGDCTLSSYILFLPHFPAEFPGWAGCRCVIALHEHVPWAGLWLKSTLSLKLCPTEGSVTVVPSGCPQEVALPEQSHVCRVRSSCSQGSVSPLLLWHSSVLVSQGWVLPESSKTMGLSLNYQCSEVWQSWAWHLVVFSSSSKNLLQKHSPDPLLAPRERIPDHRSWLQKSGEKAFKQDFLFYFFFLVLFYTWPYVGSVCKML